MVTLTCQIFGFIALRYFADQLKKRRRTGRALEVDEDQRSLQEKLA
jgi:hypothetical protein